jgi:hypothetical protein
MINRGDVATEVTKLEQEEAAISSFYGRLATGSTTSARADEVIE